MHSQIKTLILCFIQCSAFILFLIQARDTLPGCKPRPEPASKKGGTLQEYVKIPRVVDRPKTQAEKVIICY